MSQTSDALKYAKKAAILNKILLNYRQEQQSLLKKDPRLFRTVLQEREMLIEQLSRLQTAYPSSPLLQLQQQHIVQLVAKIQIERNSNPNSRWL